MKKEILLIASAALASALPAAVNLEITGVQTQISGTTTDVSGSGSSANYAAGTQVNDYAVFDISQGGSAYGQLKVTYAADNGAVGSDIMIARTSDSQGLTDTGTMSILIGSNTNTSVDITFDWYSVGSFIGGTEQAGSSFLSHQVLFTSLDIDFSQFNSVNNSEFSSVFLEQDTTNLTIDDQGATTMVTDGGQDATFADPDHAVAFLTNENSSSQTITMGKQGGVGGNALFMFEFRDPSINAPFENPNESVVPEPAATSLLVGVIALAATVRRRKRA